MLSTISHVKSVKFCWTENECTFRTYSFKKCLHEHSTCPIDILLQESNQNCTCYLSEYETQISVKINSWSIWWKNFFNKNNFFQKLNTFWNSFLTIFKVLQLGFTQSFQVQIGHRLHEHGNTATCQFGYLKQLIIYHGWWVKSPIRHGKLLASPVMLRDIKLLFQLVSLLDALSFLSFLRIKFTVKPFMYISMTAMHCTYKAELKSYLQSLNNTVQV